MASFAKAVICGNLTRDLELKFVGANATAIVQFSVAINDRRKSGDDWVDEVSYVDIVMWGKAAEHFANNCGKGSNVTIFGRLKQETWEKDGEKRSKIVVVAESANYPSNGRTQDADSDGSQQSSSSNRGSAPQRSGGPSRGSGSSANSARNQVYDEIPF